MKSFRNLKFEKFSFIYAKDETTSFYVAVFTDFTVLKITFPLDIAIRAVVLLIIWGVGEGVMFYMHAIFFEICCF